MWVSHQDIGFRSRTSIVTCIVTALLGGCSQYRDPNVPAQIHPLIEPEHEGRYLLYRPSYYEREKSWPLIVVCHSRPWDSPIRRIRKWTQLAEEYGFLVVAPELHATRTLFTPSAEEQIELLRKDNRHILAVVRHIRGGHNISEDYIFICGESGGAYAALYSGLRNPGIFRAVCLVQPRFDAVYLADVTGRLDTYQPVLVHYALSDTITGNHGRDCADWARRYLNKVTEDHGASARGGTVRRVIEFIEHVLANEPWVQIRSTTQPGGDPLKVRFTLRSSFTPQTYHWDFGDGETSPVATPVHRYQESGTYLVTVALTPKKGKPVYRRIAVEVP